MQDWVSMADAVAELVRGKKLTERMARKVIIASLIDERLWAAADSYWRDSTPAISGRARERGEHVQDDCCVPSDFWRMEHAQHFDRRCNGSERPTGSWGYWGPEGTNQFATQIVLTGFAAGDRYPDFRELIEEGSSTVTLEWTAIGVALSAVDLERLMQSGSFSALLRRVERRPSVRWGNVSRSDAFRVIARCCATFLTIAEQEELAANPSRLLQAFQNVAGTSAENAAISDRVLRGFADQVASEARQLAQIASQSAP